LKQKKLLHPQVLFIINQFKFFNIGILDIQLEDQTQKPDLIDKRASKTAIKSNNPNKRTTRKRVAKTEEIPVEPEISINYNDLTEKEKDFIRVFIEGNYANTVNPLSVEVSHNFLKDICPTPSHARYLKERFTSLLKLVETPRATAPKSQSDELTNLYTIPLEEVEDRVKWALQESSCQNFEKNVPRCSHCIFKQTDNCRFKGIRILATDSKSKKVILTPPRWQEYSTSSISYPVMITPNRIREKKGKKHEAMNEGLKIYEELNEDVPEIEREERRYLTDSHKDDYARYIIANTSSSLKSFLTLQLDLFKHSKIYLKQLSAHGLHQCDQCSSTLLNIYFLGKHCGIELCHECYLTASISNLHSRCIKGSKHTMADFIPVTIYPKEIFEWLLKKSDEISASKAITSVEIPSYMFVYNGFDNDVEDSQQLYKPYPRGTEEQFRLEGYQSAMQKGIPLVIENAAKHYYKEFSAHRLGKYYGDIRVEVIEENFYTQENVSLSEFFVDFNANEHEPPKFPMPRKIKDWPPFSDFKTLFPSMYNAFLNSLPFKECTHPDGFLNLTKYLPKSLNPPDLGPKMYIATGNEYTQGRGTSPLHLESSDTIYILTHAYRSGYELDHMRCAALWHIFDYKDIDKIRDYLKNWNESFEPGDQLEYTDCIHDHSIYLTADMLFELKELHGVIAYQIYQNPGDAVFIPAGCAYQIHNLSNCVQFSTGFISPERANQCISLAHEYRKLPSNHHAHGDIAQVQNHIIFSSSECISSLTSDKNKLLESIASPEISTKRKALGAKDKSLESEEFSEAPSKRKASGAKSQDSEPKRRSTRIKADS
jgi:hypothetical protein